MVNSIKLELLDVEENLFDLNESALLLYRETFESSTMVKFSELTDHWIIVHCPAQSRQNNYDQEVLSRISSKPSTIMHSVPHFAEMSQMTFPPRLRHLFLFGDTSTQYGVFYQNLFYGLIELYRIASMRKEGKGFKELERIEAVIGGVEESRSLGRFLSKADFGLVLRFGSKSLEYRYGPPILL